MSLASEDVCMQPKHVPIPSFPCLLDGSVLPPFDMFNQHEQYKVCVHLATGACAVSSNSASIPIPPLSNKRPNNALVYSDGGWGHYEWTCIPQFFDSSHPHWAFAYMHADVNDPAVIPLTHRDFTTMNVQERIGVPKQAYVDNLVSLWKSEMDAVAQAMQLPVMSADMWTASSRPVAALNSLVSKEPRSLRHYVLASAEVHRSCMDYRAMAMFYKFNHAKSVGKLGHPHVPYSVLGTWILRSQAEQGLYKFLMYWGIPCWMILPFNEKLP